MIRQLLVLIRERMPSENSRGAFLYLIDIREHIQKFFVIINRISTRYGFLFLTSAWLTFHTEEISHKDCPCIFEYERTSVAPYSVFKVSGTIRNFVQHWSTRVLKIELERLLAQVLLWAV